MARTIRTKVYQFNELSNDAKQKAIEWYRNGSDDGQIYSSEIIGSVKAVAELFNLKFGREYTDVRTSHIEDTILELKGVRLYKYLINNYYMQLFTHKYIKCIDRPVKWKALICKIHTYKDHQSTFIYSKQKRDNSCVLTGMCYDNDILQPVYDFLSRPDNSTTFEYLMSSIESAIDKTFDRNEEWVNSAEYITENIISNGYEFTADGRRF